MTVITGIGWITRLEYGCARLRILGEHNGMKSLHGRLVGESKIASPVRHFGRFDSTSQVTCCVVGLALHDAEVPFDRDVNKDTGLLGTNAAGSLRTNIDYFRDYVENGRTLARGNLFIYTLPSSPLAETAIHFGLRGPLLYMLSPDHGTAAMLLYASGTILAGEAAGMLAVNSDENEAICFAMRRDNPNKLAGHWKLDDALAITRENLTVDSMVRRFME